MAHVSSIVMLICIALISEIHGNIIKSGDVSTKESVTNEVSETDAELPAEISPPISVAPVIVTEKTCAKIGDFCMNHSDCCTFACLGYMKRCVSGSGLNQNQNRNE